MKVLSAALLFITVAAGSVQAQDWTPVPLGTSSDILDIDNAGFPFVWVVGGNGFVAESNANRSVWTPVDLGTSAAFYSLLLPTSSQTWVGGGQGVVRLLANGTWYTRNIPDQSEDFRLFSGGSYAATAVGTAGSIYNTSDGGVHWTAQLSGTGAALNAGTGFTTAYVVGDNGTILKTTDGGANWLAKASGTSANLYDVIANGSRLLAVGAAGTILKSTDNGESWSPLQSGTTNTLRAICTSYGNYWYVFVAVGDNGTVVRSTDGGVTWCRVNTGTNANLCAVDAYNDTEYFVGGPGGLMLHTLDGGGNCINPADVAPAVPLERLAVSMPEPFPTRGEARLRLRARDAASVEVGVFDLLGRRMTGVDRQTLPAGGEQELRFDTRAWPEGMYWVRIQGDGVVASRRILVVR
jgi:photosystem II stability/assembly factor-like uncharacterized protein